MKQACAICWLTGREIHDALHVPVGLISSNWGGTSIQVWMPSEANELCQQGNWSGDRHNAMINPFTVGPMQMAGILWYQGESNNGQGRYYSCAWPALIMAWRRLFASQRCGSVLFRSVATNTVVHRGQTPQLTSVRHNWQHLRCLKLP